MFGKQEDSPWFPWNQLKAEMLMLRNTGNNAENVKFIYASKTLVQSKLHIDASNHEARHNSMSNAKLILKDFP